VSPTRTLLGGACLIGALIGSAGRASATDSVPQPATPKDVVLFATGEAAIRTESVLAKGVTSIVWTLPRALDGTLWLDGDVVLREARSRWGNGTERTSTKGRLDLLRQSLGQSIAVRTVERSGNELIDGRLTRLLGDEPEAGRGSQNETGIELVIERNEGRAVVRLQDVAAIRFESAGADLDAYDANVRLPRLEAEFAAGRRDRPVALTYLAKGLAWRPSYVLRLGDEQAERAELEGKAVLINDLAPLVDTRVRLLVGDAPLDVGGALTALWPGATPVPTATWSATTYQADKAPAMIDMEMSRTGDYKSAGGPPPPPKRDHDVHVYDLGPRTLGVGERLWVPLTEATPRADHRWVWTLGSLVDPYDRFQPPPPAALDPPVRHVVELTHDGDQPWTEATLLVEGVLAPLARTRMPWTMPGGTAEIPLGDSGDFERHSEERRVEQPGGKRPTVTRFNQTYEQVRIEGEWELIHRGDTARTIRVERTVRGDLVDAEGNPEIENAPLELGRVNIARKLNWSFDLAPGATRKVVYRYDALVRR